MDTSPNPRLYRLERSTVQLRAQTSPSSEIFWAKDYSYPGGDRFISKRGVHSGASDHRNRRVSDDGERSRPCNRAVYILPLNSRRDFDHEQDRSSVRSATLDSFDEQVRLAHRECFVIGDRSRVVGILEAAQVSWGHESSSPHKCPKSAGEVAGPSLFGNGPLNIAEVPPEPGKALVVAAYRLGQHSNVGAQRREGLLELANVRAVATNVRAVLTNDDLKVLDILAVLTYEFRQGQEFRAQHFSTHGLSPLRIVPE